MDCRSMCALVKLILLLVSTTFVGCMFSPAPARLETAELLESPETEDLSLFLSLVDGTVECPKVLSDLENSTQISVCLNEMRSSPSSFSEIDPCRWVIFSEEVNNLAINNQLAQVAKLHAQNNAELQDPVGKFADGLSRLPSQVLSDEFAGLSFNNLHVSVQAGPGNGGVFGVVSGWMCVEERREIALSCEFDLQGVGVQLNDEDSQYYIVKYQACSKPLCSCD
eukprot:TRINITY_DN5073_c0_g1_i1.p2 TRINITY_DN5073_c0_g1~~TRINITY_DN5073_c0_g1_i1.p2  ORF type:complete len:224 (-),score=29.11 TRINITY_DN5073_c0_g1_i1:316-987(-)